jgi:hypothetical protein
VFYVEYYQTCLWLGVKYQTENPVDHLSFIMLGATLVQTQYQSMEIIDSMDKMTPADGDWVDL